MSDAIRIENLSKLYRRTSAGFRMRTLKSALLQRSLTQGLGDDQTIPALMDVDFAVAKGEAFGVIGSNGSGKSTLLKIMAGILEPTKGRRVIDGRVAALIELGAGFHPEISGRENIFINGAILGMSRARVVKRFDDIVIGRDQQVQTPVLGKVQNTGSLCVGGNADAAFLRPTRFELNGVINACPLTSKYQA